MTTRPAVRQEMLRRTGLGFTATATGGTATTVTATDYLLNSGIFASEEYENRYIHRPDATAAADRIRIASSWAAGTLTHNGASYTNVPTNNEAIEITLVDPTILNQCFSRTLRLVKRTRWVPLGITIADGDMGASDATNYTASSATLSKVTTAANIKFGPRSLRVANSAANGYGRTASIPVAPNAAYYAWGFTRADVGTAGLQSYDVTNSAVISTYTTVNEIWSLIGYGFNAPGGCEEVQLRLRGSEATADCYWNAIGLYRIGQNLLDIIWNPGYDPSHVVDVFAFYPKGYSGSENNVWTLDNLDITQPYKWDWFQEPPNTNWFIKLTPGCKAGYIPFAQTSEPRRDITDETTTTGDPDNSNILDVLAAGMAAFVYEYLAAQAPAGAERERMLGLLRYWTKSFNHLRNNFNPILSYNPRLDW